MTVEDKRPLNAVKYATKDYPSIFDSVMRRLREQYGEIYNDYSTSSVGVMLIDLMAYAVEQLQWYMDRISSDCYLDTARTRSAIESLVQQIGYKMRAAAPASVDEQLTFPAGIPGNGILPAGFKFGGPDGMTFETTADLSLDVSLVPVVKTVTIRQGLTRTSTYTGDGTQNQRYLLSAVTGGAFCASGSVRIWVDGQEWTENDFLTFEKTNQFEVSYLDDPPSVRFGDGSAGNIPPDGAEVKVEYVVINGAAGNVKANTITDVIGTLKILGSDVTIEATNLNGASGGTDPEDPEQARRYAPYYFAARDAVITKKDYETLANTFVSYQYGAVAKAFADVVRTAYSDENLNKLIDLIDGTVESYATSMAAQESAISVAASSMTTSLNNAVATKDSMVAIKDDDLVPNIATIRTTAQGAKVSTTTISGDLLSATDLLDGMDAQIDLLPSSTEKTALQTLSSQMSSLFAEMTTKANSLGPQMDTIMSAGQVLDDKIDGSISYQWTYADAAARIGATGFVSTDVGKFALQQDNYSSWMLVSTTPTWMQVSDVQSIASGLANLATYLDEIATERDTMAVAADVISGASEVMSDAVQEETHDVQEYVGTIFDGDCRANVVQVPILARSGDGSYMAPSAGLIKAVQVYLDERKEVTQQVQVIDGSYNLVGANVVVRLKPLSTVVTLDVVSQADATVTSMLSGRDFNQPLYLSAVYDALKTAIGEQVTYLNVEITGPTEYIDGDGNLVPPSQKVIVKGTVTVQEI